MFLTKRYRFGVELCRGVLAVGSLAAGIFGFAIAYSKYPKPNAVGSHYADCKKEIDWLRNEWDVQGKSGIAGYIDKADANDWAQVLFVEVLVSSVFCWCIFILELFQLGYNYHQRYYKKPLEEAQNDSIYVIEVDAVNKPTHLRDINNGEEIRTQALLHPTLRFLVVAPPDHPTETTEGNDSNELLLMVDADFTIKQVKERLNAEHFPYERTKQEYVLFLKGQELVDKRTVHSYFPKILDFAIDVIISYSDNGIPSTTDEGETSAGGDEGLLGESYSTGRAQRVRTPPAVRTQQRERTPPEVKLKRDAEILKMHAKRESLAQMELAEIDRGVRSLPQIDTLPIQTIPMHDDDDFNLNQPGRFSELEETDTDADDPARRTPDLYTTRYHSRPPTSGPRPKAVYVARP